MRKQALISLIIIGAIIVSLGSIRGVNASITTLTKDHHPVSSLKDPSGTVDGYLVGQTVTWYIYVNVTSSRTNFPWLSITELAIVDTLPNLGEGQSLHMIYVPGSQSSSSASGPATFTDFGNGTLFWNFSGPITTGTVAPPPFSDADEFYTASITFNATILGNVPDRSFFTNRVAATYTETISGIHSAPSASDTIWVHDPPGFVVPEVPLLGVAGAALAIFFAFFLFLAKRRKKDDEDEEPRPNTHGLKAR